MIISNDDDLIMIIIMMILPLRKKMFFVKDLSSNTLGSYEQRKRISQELF